VPDKQLLIAQILDLDSTDAAELFDTAARERREIPADIARYYLIDDATDASSGWNVPKN